MEEYDLVVIGAGSGGLVAATSGHRKGLKTALVEKNKIGGECTHYGCVPSKALINASKAYHSFGKMEKLGIDSSTPPADFKAIMEKVDNIVQGIYKHETPDIFENMGIDVFVNKSGASFIDNETISIGEETLKAKNFVICSGSSPRIPEVKGIEKAKVLHNENFWELREHPGKIVFIGGGVISVELGQALSRIGCEVCILERNERILRATDPEIGGYFTGLIEKEGVQIIYNATIQAFTAENTLSYEKDGAINELTADHFFFATGRLPNVNGMNLENAGIEYTGRGIKTNEYLQTTAENIFACGDVTTPAKFTHVASHQANICIANILKPSSKKNDLSVLPWAIFTEPEIGHVGLSENAAIEKFGAENISVFKVDASIDRFITDRKTGGFIKVLFNNEDLVVGADAVGAHAGEWIQLLTLVIKNKIPAAEMADTIFLYPSYSEIVKKVFTRYLRSKST